MSDAHPNINDPVFVQADQMYLLFKELVDKKPGVCYPSLPPQQWQELHDLLDKDNSETYDQKLAEFRAQQRERVRIRAGN